MRRKPSRGLVALVPGATLDVDVPGLGLHVGQDASVGSGWRMQLQYLVSYEGMGTLTLTLTLTVTLTLKLTLTRCPTRAWAA